MEPRLEQREGFTVIGVLARGKVTELDFHTIWGEEFGPREAEVRPLSVDPGYYAAFYCAGVAGEVEVLSGMRVAADAPAPEGLTKRAVAAALCAVFDCTLATIGQTWGGLEGWLSQSAYDYDRDGKSDYEYYPPDTAGPDSPVQIVVPVRAR